VASRLTTDPPFWRDATLWLIGVAALVVYAPAIWWGLPQVTAPALVLHGWDVDGVAGINVLAELHNLLVASRPDWYVAYPLFHYLVLGVCYAPYVVYLVLSGGLSAPSAEYPYGFADPTAAVFTLALVGRLVTLMMACGLVMTAYLIATTAWDRATGVVAAAVAGLTGPMLYYARTGNLDVPVLFWTALAILVLARSVAHGFTVRRAVAFGAVAALAVATKDQAYGVLLPAAAVLAVHHHGSAADRSRWAALLAILVSACVVYVLANGVIISPRRFVAHLEYLRNFERTFFYVAELGRLRPPTVAGYAQLFLDVGDALCEAMGPVLLAVACLGVVATWRSTPFARVLAAMWLGHLVLTIMPVRHMQYRYAIFPAFILAFFAARVVVLAWRTGTAAKAVAVSAIVIGVGWLGVKDVDLTYQMLFDARQDAGRWLAERTNAGDAVGYFGLVDQLPLFPAGVQPVRLSADESALAALQDKRVRYVLVSPDWTSDAGAEHSRFMAERVYESLKNGTSDYQLAARFETRPLFGRPLKYLPFVNPTVQSFARAAEARINLPFTIRQRRHT